MVSYDLHFCWCSCCTHSRTRALIFSFIIDILHGQRGMDEIHGGKGEDGKLTYVTSPACVTYCF